MYVKRDEYVQEQYEKIYGLFGTPTYSVYEKSVWKHTRPFYDVILYNKGLDTNKQSIVVVGLQYDSNISFDRLFSMFSVVKEAWYQQLEKVIYVRYDSFERCVVMLELIYTFLTTSMTQDELQQQYLQKSKDSVSPDGVRLALTFLKNKV